MIKKIAVTFLFLFATSAFGATGFGWGQGGGEENECPPLSLGIFVKGPYEIGLNERDIEYFIRGRLQAAWIHTEPGLVDNDARAVYAPWGWGIPANNVNTLIVDALPMGKAYVVDLKWLSGNRIAWVRSEITSSLTLMKNLTADVFILQSISQLTDEFIDEYSRVNGDGC